MTNNTTFNASIIANAKAALEAAEKQLEVAKSAAKGFIVDYVKSKDGEIVSVKELSEKTGLSPSVVGSTLSKRFDMRYEDFKVRKRYIEIDDNDKPIPDTIREFETRTSGYAYSGRRY